jgi:hypothetical protein
MPRSIAGLRIADNTTRVQRHFSPAIAESWIQTILRYCIYYRRRFDADDLPYGYTERANIGLLSIAAHDAGYLAIEEYSEMKGKGTRRRMGRVDLAIMKEMELVIEAKWDWTSPEKVAPCATRTLNRALDDMDNSYVPKKDDIKVRRSAVAFVVVNFRSDEKNPSSIVKRIKAAIREAQAVDCDICAWVFPKETRYCDWGSDADEKFHYAPGVMLFLKHERRKRI